MSSQPYRTAIAQAEQTLYNEGMKLREQVLGSSHVSASRELSPLQQPIQSLAASAGWGLCWTRPGLDLKTRSLITVSLLTSIGADHELPVHVRGALHNGCTPEEIMEAIYQVRVLYIFEYWNVGRVRWLTLCLGFADWHLHGHTTFVEWFADREQNH